MTRPLWPGGEGALHHDHARTRGDDEVGRKRHSPCPHAAIQREPAPVLARHSPNSASTPILIPPLHSSSCSRLRFHCDGVSRVTQRSEPVTMTSNAEILA